MHFYDLRIQHVVLQHEYAYYVMLRYPSASILAGTFIHCATKQHLHSPTLGSEQQPDLKP